MAAMSDRGVPVVSKLSILKEAITVASVASSVGFAVVTLTQVQMSMTAVQNADVRVQWADAMLLHAQASDAGAMLALALVLQAMETRVSGATLGVMTIVQRTAAFYSVGFMFVPHYKEGMANVVEKIVEFNVVTVILLVALGDQV